MARAAACELERSGYTAIRFPPADEDEDGPALRAISRVSDVIAETKPVRIVVCLRSSLEELPLRELLEQRIQGVPIETGHEAYERLTGKIFLDETTPLHLLLSHAGRSNCVYGTTKRFVSAALAAVALLVALPVMALVALSIYMTDGGPVFFVQERVGLHGRPFRLLKFRSMRVEKRTSSEWERDNEDRITPLGRWLRRLHLDELPQLWNIWRGDMAFIGPRPHPVSNHALFARSIPYYSLRSVVRPGLTGWAQVRQGYAHDLAGEIEKMRYDLCAIARSSLLHDLSVLLQTAKIVLVGRTALEREALTAVETTDRADSVAVSFWARMVRALLPASIRDLREGIEPHLAMASVRRQSFVRLLAVVVLLFMAGTTFQLIAQPWTRTWRSPTVQATAVSTSASEPVSPTAAAEALVIGAREATSPVALAATTAGSSDAAAATAEAIVERSENSRATVLKPVLAERIPDQGFIDGINRPRYQATVAVEIPRRRGIPIERRYFVTLRYLGGGEWQIDGMKFATRY